jgi:dGTPase
MYRHSDVDRERARNHRIVVELFERFMQDPALLPEEWHRDATAGGEKERARTIGDYIAGMTDRYARAEHERLCGGAPPASAMPRPSFRRRSPV